jgi:hypothetical protein
VHVDLDGPGQGVGAGVVDVRGAPTAVPEVGGRVFVCDGDEGERGVVGDGVDAGAGFGVVLGGVGAEGFDEALTRLN